MALEIISRLSKNHNKVWLVDINNWKKDPNQFMVEAVRKSGTVQEELTYQDVCVISAKLTSCEDRIKIDDD